MSLFILTVCLFGRWMRERTDGNQTPLRPLAYGSTLLALLDKHRLAAQVANVKPAGRGAEPQAL